MLAPNKHGHNKNKNKNTGSNSSSRPNTPAMSELVSDSDLDEIMDDLDFENPIEGTDFEIEVKTSLCSLTTAFFGNPKTKKVGLIKRVSDVEKDLYGKGRVSSAVCTAW